MKCFNIGVNFMVAEKKQTKKTTSSRNKPTNASKSKKKSVKKTVSSKANSVFKKELAEIKKLQGKLEKTSSKIFNKLSNDVKKIEWDKVKDPAMYAGLGFLGGVLLGSLFKKKK